MKIKTSRLIGPALDWAVAKCVELQGVKFGKGFYGEKLLLDENEFGHRLSYSTNWAQGGPIIEQEKISTTVDHSGLWIAFNGYNYSDEKEFMQCDRSKLVAGLRCYVASKLGNEVEIPEGLL